MMRPLLSVLVSAYNDPDNLHRCMRALSACTIDGFSVEVVVCDDGSTDNMLDAIRPFERDLDVRYVYQPDRGFRLAASRNLGLAIARGDYLLFLDADLVLAPDALLAHVRGHQAGPVGECVVLGPNFGYSADASTAIDLLDRLGERWHEEVEHWSGAEDIRWRWWDLADRAGGLDALPHKWTMYMGGNSSVAKELAATIAGFDESIEGWGAEDTDFGYRLAMAGASFRVARAAKSMHLPRLDAAEGWLKRESHVANRRRLLWKYCDPNLELLPYYRVSTFAARLEVHRSYWRTLDFSDYDFMSVLSHARRSTRGRLRAGLMGAGSISSAVFDVVIDPDHDRCEALVAQWPSLAVLQSVGAHMDLPDRALDVVIVTDYWRALDGRVGWQILHEACRVADEVLVLYTPSLLVRPVPGCVPGSLDELCEVSTEWPSGRLVDAKLVSIDTGACGRTNVYSVQASP